MTKYGIQMYSLRDVTRDDLRGALKAVSDMGYKYVEFAGFFDNAAEDVRAWLDEYGLVASGTHTGLSALSDENFDATVKYHKTIGCTNIIVPSANWKSAADLEANIAAFNKLHKKLLEEGISLGYHNHSSEFYATPYGKVVEDEIYNRTSVMLEIDTFWLFNAGIDPVPYLEAHKDRISVIHLKDGNVNVTGSFENAHAGAVGKSLGSGVAPIAAVREWALKNDVIMVVESEGLDPTGTEEVKRCIDYLGTLEA